MRHLLGPSILAIKAGGSVSPITKRLKTTFGSRIGRKALGGSPSAPSVVQEPNQVVRIGLAAGPAAAMRR